MRFPVIVADPPWHYECWSERTSDPMRRASGHYAVQDTDWIASLAISDVAEANCCLFLWATWPNLLDAIRVVESWGFRYTTLAFDWIKVSKDGNPLLRLGYWTRTNSEPCLLAKRGNPSRGDRKCMDKSIGQVLISGPGAHSQKPDEMYTRIERLVEGPYLELFHRPRNGLFPPREGWTFLGNEVTGNDMADDLRALAQKEAIVR